MTRKIRKHTCTMIIALAFGLLMLGCPSKTREHAGSYSAEYQTMTFVRKGGENGDTPLMYSDFWQGYIEGPEFAGCLPKIPEWIVDFGDPGERPTPCAGHPDFILGQDPLRVCLCAGKELDPETGHVLYKGMCESGLKAGKTWTFTPTDDLGWPHEPGTYDQQHLLIEDEDGGIIYDKKTVLQRDIEADEFIVMEWPNMFVQPFGDEGWWALIEVDNSIKMGLTNQNENQIWRSWNETDTAHFIGHVTVAAGYFGNAIGAQWEWVLPIELTKND